MDAEQRVTHLAAVVLEITENKKLEQSLNYMIGNLLNVGAALKTELQFRGFTNKWSAPQIELLPRAIELVEQCIVQAQNISEVTRRYRGAKLTQLRLPNGRDLNESAEAPRMNFHGVDAGGATRQLSPRECRVLQLLAECKTNKEVAAELRDQRTDSRNLSSANHDEARTSFRGPPGSICSAK